MLRRIITCLFGQRIQICPRIIPVFCKKIQRGIASDEGFAIEVMLLPSDVKISLSGIYKANHFGLYTLFVLTRDQVLIDSVNHQVFAGACIVAKVGNVDGLLVLCDIFPVGIFGIRYKDCRFDFAIECINAV